MSRKPTALDRTPVMSRIGEDLPAEEAAAIVEAMEVLGCLCKCSGVSDFTVGTSHGVFSIRVQYLHES